MVVGTAETRYGESSRILQSPMLFHAVGWRHCRITAVLAAAKTLLGQRYLKAGQLV
jgi:hypothetical protein